MRNTICFLAATLIAGSLVAQTQVDTSQIKGSTAGDTSGPLQSMTVTGLQNRPVSSGAPSNGYVLTWNGTTSQWEAQAISPGNATQLQGRTLSSAAPSAGHVLTWNAGASRWEPQTGASSSNAVQLQGRNVSSSTPTEGQMLVWNDQLSRWEPGTITSGVASLFGRTGIVIAAQDDYFPGQLGCSMSTSGTILTIFPGATGLKPCVVSIGDVEYVFVSPATVTLAGTGTGQAFVYVAPGGVLTVGHELNISSCTGCTATARVSAFPAFTRHIGIASATAGTWDATVSDRRGWLSAAPKLVNAGGITITPAGDTVSLGIDSAVYASYGRAAVAYSEAPIFAVTSTVHLFEVTLAGDVTSSSVSGALPGGLMTFKICQDASGNRTFAWPANFNGAMTVDGTADKCSVQTFVWDGTKAYATSTGVSGL
jgi:hypothetical protein